jgi:hypothetical protein
LSDYSLSDYSLYRILIVWLHFKRRLHVQLGTCSPTAFPFCKNIQPARKPKMSCWGIYFYPEQLLSVNYARNWLHLWRALMCSLDHVKFDSCPLKIGYHNDWVTAVTVMDN